MAVLVVVGVFDVDEAPVAGGGDYSFVLEGEGRDEDEGTVEVQLLGEFAELVDSHPDQNQDVGVHLPLEKNGSLLPDPQADTVFALALQRYHEHSFVLLHSRENLHHRKYSAFPVPLSAMLQTLSQFLVSTPDPFGLDHEISVRETGLPQSFNVTGQVDLVVVEGVELGVFVALHQGVADYHEDLDDLLLVGTGALPDDLQGVKLVDLVLQLVGEVAQLLLAFVEDGSDLEDGPPDGLLLLAVEELDRDQWVGWIPEVLADLFLLG